MSFIQIANAIDQLARVVRSGDWKAKQAAPLAAGDQQPASDQTGTLIAHQSDLGSSHRIEYGSVQDAIPTARCYRVAPEGGGPVLDCKLGMRSAVAPFGTYDADTLVPGTGVFFVRHKQSEGVIICAEPVYMTDPTLCYSDVVSMGSNTGLHVETGFQQPFSMGGTAGSIPLNGGITDYSGRTPVDSLEIGEFNRSTETGLMMHMDSYMAFTRVNEVSGLWMFYYDGLVRLAGENYQQWSAASEVEAYDDEGEHFWYQGIATYPWEHQGMLQGPYASSAYEFTDPADPQLSYPYYARVEPNNDDLQPFHRMRTYAGYVGQGQKKLLCAPDLRETGADELLYSDTYYQPVGLHEQNIALSGHYGMRNALGITFAKRPIIPVPKRVEIVTSHDGDKPANYKASSYYGSGSEHKVQPGPWEDNGLDPEHVNPHMAAAVLDLHAYLFNWETAHPFHYHSNDYVYPDEEDYDHVASNQEVPTWSDLDSEYQWYLDPADYDTITIDHRTGETAYVYRNTSYLTFLDQGGIVMGDGFGSEIRMVGGCIFLSCPGDVFLEAGRNVISWGGRDVILRAKQSVDVSANDKDVRIKAEENLHMLGGNSGGTAGVMIESRSSGPAHYDFTTVGQDCLVNGIILKAPSSEIVGYGKNIYLRTKFSAGKSSGDAIASPTIAKDGDIVLDTLGQGEVITRTEYVKHYVKCAVAHIFPDSPSFHSVNMFTEDGATLCGDVYTDGDLLSWGSHVCRGDFSTSSGHFYSPAGGVIGAMTGAGAASIGEAVEQGQAYETTLVTWAGTQYGSDMTQNWYGDGRPGNATIITSAWVSMRVEEDYKTDSFVLFESRWQQMARLNGDAVETWTENAVESNLDEPEDWANTYPFPGKQRMEEDDAFRWQPLTLYDGTTGQSNARGADYEPGVGTPIELDPPTEKNLNDDYKCIPTTL